MPGNEEARRWGSWCAKHHNESPSFARYKLVGIGERMRYTRLLKRLSIPAVSQLIDYCPRNIGYWETGTRLPTLWALAHWADVCDTTIPYLLGYEGYDEPLRVFTGEIPLRTTSKHDKARASKKAKKA